MEKLLRKSFIEELKLDGTYNDSSFAREYESEWSGDAENAFFSAEKFDKHRVLLQPEYEYSGRSSKNAYYILGVDVGRYGCTTEVCIFKVTPQVQGASLKTLVNIYTYDAEDFEAQAISIKKLFYKYKLLIIDEVGFNEISSLESKLFFQLIDARYTKRSTIFTSNITFDKWPDILGGDEMITKAILDRILHYSYLFNINGPSYRIKDKLDPRKSEES